MKKKQLTEAEELQLFRREKKFSRCLELLMIIGLVVQGALLWNRLRNDRIFAENEAAQDRQKVKLDSLVNYWTPESHRGQKSGFIVYSPKGQVTRVEYTSGAIQVPGATFYDSATVAKKRTK